VARPGRPPSQPWEGGSCRSGAGKACRAPTWQTEGREEVFERIPDQVAELAEDARGGRSGRRRRRQVHGCASRFGALVESHVQIINVCLVVNYDM
jgi:hypothetical protein